MLTFENVWKAWNIFLDWLKKGLALFRPKNELQAYCGFFLSKASASLKGSLPWLLLLLLLYKQSCLLSCFVRDYQLPHGFFHLKKNILVIFTSHWATSKNLRGLKVCVEDRHFAEKRWWKIPECEQFMYSLLNKVKSSLLKKKLYLD